MNERDITPVVIEAAITPFRRGEPVQDADAMAAEARSCLTAGAGIIHHHHDLRLDEDAAIEEMLTFGRAVRHQFPDSLLYPDFLRGDTVEQKIAHFDPLAAAGVLGLAPVDPGAVAPYGLDADGIPNGSGHMWNTVEGSRVIVEAAMRCGVGVTVGVYEPVQLRWALAYRTAGQLPPGSMIKLYFGGRHSLFDLGRPALNFGLPPTRSALDAYLEMLEGSGLHWNVGLMGDSLLDSPIARYALERGGHLRVGVEDIAAVTDATNEETVRAAVALAAQVGRPVATGVAARDVLSATSTVGV